MYPGFLVSRGIHVEILSDAAAVSHCAIAREEASLEKYQR